jgi:hypothetical protein
MSLRVAVKRKFKPGNFAVNYSGATCIRYAHQAETLRSEALRHVTG